MRRIQADIAVVGGGAAGCVAAFTAAGRGRSVALVEQNVSIGRKLRITGKGRCNLTNLCETRKFLENVPQNAKFLYSALNSLPPADTMVMFEDMGLKLKTERGNRVFPASDDANDVAAALSRRLSGTGVMLFRDSVAEVLTANGAVTGLRCADTEILCQSVIIATGGASYTATGSTGDGYRFAKKLGHSVTKLRPSLIPLVEDGHDCRGAMGLSLKNTRLTAFEDGVKIFEDFGELLFTHFGLSGPLTLSASAHMRHFGEKSYLISLDLKPALDFEALDRRLLSDFAENLNRDFINSLDALLPQKIIPAVVARSGIGPRLKVHSITKPQRLALLTALKSFTVKIKEPRPIDEAVITSGGVDTRELDPRTMRSKLISGLYFAGEVIDVDAYTGGFNLQIAWSTGYLAGKNA